MATRYAIIKFSLALSILVFCLSCEKKELIVNRNNDLAKLGYYGYVNDVIYTSIQRKEYFENGLPGFIDKYHVVFNIYGNIETYQKYANLSDIELIKEYTYDPQLRPVKVNTLTDDVTKNIYVTTKYDSADNVLENLQTKGNSFVIHRYRYDSLSNPVHHTQLTNEDTMELSITNFYNSDGKKIKSEQIDLSNNGLNNLTHEFVYDTSGNLIGEKKNSAMLGRFDFTYTYNKRNQVKSSIQTDSITGSTETRYDEYKNPIYIKTTSMRGDVKIITYEYTFDDFHNWISRKTFLAQPDKNGALKKKPYSDETQEFIYYKFVRKRK